MNILFCLDSTFSRKNGGIASVSITLKKGFERRGHKCYMLSAKKNRDDACCDQYYLPTSTTDFSNKENNIWFRNFIQEKHIDVIINQNGGTPSSIWALEWSKDLPIRRLTVYHGDFNSLWSCHRDAIMENILVKTFHLRSFVNYVWKIFFRYKYRRLLCYHSQLSDKLVFLTDKYYAGFEWFSGVKNNEKFAAIHNSVEEEFEIDTDELTKENIVLFVGRLSTEKRLDYLFEIWKNVSIEHPKWSLFIVGDGPMRKKYEYIVNRLQLTNVFIEGYHLPLEYYKRAKIFCLTSETEGFSLVLVESMCCGCVPIAFNSYACASDIIDDGKCGYLISPFNIESYTQRLSVLMDNEELRKNMVKSAREKTRQFLLERIIGKWENLFNM